MTQERPVSATAMLSGTPYLITDGDAAARKFDRILDKATEVREKAIRVGDLVRQQAENVFESFGLVLRSEVVSESNRMEHIEWTPSEVREAVLRHRDLLALPAHAFVESVRADNRTYEVLGLYRAQLLAEEWATSTGPRPREYEIRQLHSLIVGDAHYAGRYKLGDNKISGSAHVPPSAAEAADGMRLLADWWQAGSSAPALDAAVVHAWLAHLHPFDDGNGRLARLLANLALSQHKYPPLVIEASSDRGEYYDALASSDEGDVLPLFDLFTRLLRRAVRRMGQPGYIESVIRDRMLTTQSQQHQLWEALALRFTNSFRDALREWNLEIQVQGYPSNSAFSDLAELRSDGNSWYLKVNDDSGQPRWLLWFGFNSADYREVFSGRSEYPSVFLSARADDPLSIHPYVPLAASGDDSIWTELVLLPGRAKPARLLVGFNWKELSVDEAANHAAALLARRS